MKMTFKLRPEQWVVAGAFVFLAVAALFKAWTLPDVDAFSPGGGKTRPGTYDTAQIADLAERWQKPPVIPQTDHKVYVSRLIVYKPDTQKIGPLSGDGVIKGMSVSWLQKNGFSLEDPKVDRDDPDKDGFSNLEEYKGETDPLDVKSHPDFIKKLCLKDYQYIPFKLIFKGYSPNVSGDGLIFQINLLNVKRKNTRMIEKGGDLEGYRVGEFRKKIVERFNKSTGINEQIDVSELNIINPALDEPVTLVLNEETESDESRVTFQLNVPGESPHPASVKRGETFKIKAKTYQLLAASVNEAQVKQVDTGEEFRIPKCGTEAASK